jgi:transcriptional regulator with XRE-family HTH domain
MVRAAKSLALGSALRKVREEKRITLRELAVRISRNQGDLSRMETGEKSIKPEQAAQILTALGVNGDQYDEIIALAYRTNEPLWVAASLPEQRQQVMALVNFEQQATKITEVSPLLIPGLLQTSNYTRAMMKQARVPNEEIATRVATRMGRKDVITRQDPVQFTALISHFALTHIIGDKIVMLEQLRHLRDMARRPNVDLRLIRPDSGWSPALEGQFLLIEFRKSTPIVHLENRRSVLFLYEGHDVDAYRQAVMMVLDASMNAGETTQQVAKVIKKMESSP